MEEILEENLHISSFLVVMFITSWPSESRVKLSYRKVILPDTLSRLSLIESLLAFLSVSRICGILVYKAGHLTSYLVTGWLVGTLVAAWQKKTVAPWGKAYFRCFAWKLSCVWYLVCLWQNVVLSPFLWSHLFPELTGNQDEPLFQNFPLLQVSPGTCLKMRDTGMELHPSQ